MTTALSLATSAATFEFCLLKFSTLLIGVYHEVSTPRVNHYLHTSQLSILRLLRLLRILCLLLPTSRLSERVVAGKHRCAGLSLLDTSEKGKGGKGERFPMQSPTLLVVPIYYPSVREYGRGKGAGNPAGRSSNRPKIDSNASTAHRLDYFLCGEKASEDVGHLAIFGGRSV